MEHCDVAIVGAGASGLAVAWSLARRGLKVIVLEQGGTVDQHQSPSLSLDWERALQTRFNPDPNRRRLPSDYPVAVAETCIQPATYSGVGGATLRWGAHFPRLRPSDFRVRSLDGVAEDWPIAYRDLEHWFDLNDRMTGVAGLVGDPANPLRRGERLPPLPLGPGPTRLAQALDGLGWHWWPSDAAICSTSQPGRAACNLCGPCGVGCPRLARASADVVDGRPAAQAGAEIRTHSRVQRVELDSSGRAAELKYVRGGEQHALQATAIVIAANGMGSVRLLLASANARHRGPARPGQSRDTRPEADRQRRQPRSGAALSPGRQHQKHAAGVAALTPAPLRPGGEPIVRFSVHQLMCDLGRGTAWAQLHPEESCFREAVIGIAVTHRERIGFWDPFLWTDSDAELAVGRELYGWPQPGIGGLSLHRTSLVACSLRLGIILRPQRRIHRIRPTPPQRQHEIQPATLFEVQSHAATLLECAKVSACHMSCIQLTTC